MTRETVLYVVPKTPEPAPAPPPSFPTMRPEDCTRIGRALGRIRRVLRIEEPSTFQKGLALHMHDAEKKSALK
jgi:hypothetical protein